MLGLSAWIEVQNTILSVREKIVSFKDKNWLKIKAWKKIYSSDANQNKTQKALQARRE